MQNLLKLYKIFCSCVVQSHLKLVQLQSWLESKRPQSWFSTSSAIYSFIQLAPVTSWQ